MARWSLSPLFRSRRQYKPFFFFAALFLAVVTFAWLQADILPDQDWSSLRKHKPPVTEGTPSQGSLPETGGEDSQPGQQEIDLEDEVHTEVLGQPPAQDASGSTSTVEEDPLTRPSEYQDDLDIANIQIIGDGHDEEKARLPENDDAFVVDTEKASDTSNDQSPSSLSASQAHDETLEVDSTLDKELEGEGQSHTDGQQPGGSHVTPGQAEIEDKVTDRRFVLVIPATSPSPDFCKTIATALALGYPTPIVLNWGLDYRKITKWEGGRNLPKIPGLVQYLEAALHPDAHPSERLHEDDLVLMIDAYDSWFQLPAELFLRRYHDINTEANERLRQQWNRTDPMPMKQTIIAGSGKRCAPPPGEGADLHCDDLPQSPLRSDLYGLETDKIADKESPFAFHNNRPRYINGGLYLGPAGDLRRMFRRALQIFEVRRDEGLHWANEQGIPGEIWGEQEIWRRWQRQDEVAQNDALGLAERDVEYHIGLDYGQDLAAQTYHTRTEDGVFDGAILALNDRKAIDLHSEILGINTTRLGGVPHDIEETKNPLAGIQDEANWGEMPLYADFFTEAVPAILHHNGFKERRTTLWSKPWFHEHLRQLVEKNMAATKLDEPLASVAIEQGTVNYWSLPAESNDKRPRMMVETATARLPSMAFDDVCRYPDGDGDWWDEVFRDQKGPLSWP